MRTWLAIEQLMSLPTQARDKLGILQHNDTDAYDGFLIGVGICIGMGWMVRAIDRRVMSIGLRSIWIRMWRLK